MSESPIRARLETLEDPEYREFQMKLIPGIDPDRVLGIRTPDLRAYAKQLLRTGEAAGFLAVLPHDTFDENQLHAFVISGIRDFPDCLAEVERFLPYVDNWATCDQLSPSCFARHTEELSPVLDRWLHSEHVYTVRFAIGMRMRYYLEDLFEDRYPREIAELRSDEYYIRMMVAWYFATALAKQYDRILPYLRERRLPEWTHNKTIQKAVESRRITEQEKEELRRLRLPSSGR